MLADARLGTSLYLASEAASHTVGLDVVVDNHVGYVLLVIECG